MLSDPFPGLLEIPVAIITTEWEGELLGTPVGAATRSPIIETKLSDRVDECSELHVPIMSHQYRIPKEVRYQARFPVAKFCATQGQGD